MIITILLSVSGCFLTISHKFYPTPMILTLVTSNGFRVASLKDFNLEPLVHGGMFCHGRHSQKAISFRKRLIWKGNLNKGNSSCWEERVRVTQTTYLTWYLLEQLYFEVYEKLWQVWLNIVSYVYLFNNRTLLLILQE